MFWGSSKEHKITQPTVDNAPPANSPIHSVEYAPFTGIFDLLCKTSDALTPFIDRYQNGTLPTYEETTKVAQDWVSAAVNSVKLPIQTPEQKSEIRKKFREGFEKFRDGFLPENVIQRIQIREQIGELNTNPSENPFIEFLTENLKVRA